METPPATTPVVDSMNGAFGFIIFSINLTGEGDLFLYERNNKDSF